MKKGCIVAFTSWLALVTAIPLNKWIVVKVLKMAHFNTTVWVLAEGVKNSAVPSLCTCSLIEQEPQLHSLTPNLNSFTESTSPFSSFPSTSFGDSPSTSFSSFSSTSFSSSPSTLFSSSSSTSLPSALASAPFSNQAATMTSVYSPSAQSTSSADNVDDQCTSGAPYFGDITYYTAELSACGFTDDGNHGDIVALSVGMSTSAPYSNHN